MLLVPPVGKQTRPLGDHVEDFQQSFIAKQMLLAIRSKLFFLEARKQILIMQNSSSIISLVVIYSETVDMMPINLDQR